MSKQYKNKKEAALTLQKFYSALEANRQPEEAPLDSDYKSKYNLLLKRFRELEKVFDFHRGIIQQISSGVITTDLNGSITFINRAAQDIFGYHYLDIQGQNISTLFAEPEQGTQFFKRVIKEGHQYQSKETYLITKDGELIPAGFSTSYYLNPENKEPEGVIFIFRNITVVNNLRRQLERMERLATLGEISAGIAHEIRNPLAGIKTSAQVLEESFSPGDFRSQLVSRIVKEIDRSNDLLKRFFNFAKPGRPKQEFQDIEMIIDGVYLLMAPRLKKRNITFHTDFSSEMPRLYIDGSQIEQVILNLFINAVEAMPEGGKIMINTKIVKEYVFEQGSQQAVVVEIADTGRGIPIDQQEKIFNPFFTTKSDGVGLGLSISTRLLEENGGKIEVDSAEGKGSSFRIYFPVIESDTSKIR